MTGLDRNNLKHDNFEKNKSEETDNSENNIFEKGHIWKEET